jgi:hypothetical protein
MASMIEDGKPIQESQLLQSFSRSVAQYGMETYGKAKVELQTKFQAVMKVADQKVKEVVAQYDKAITEGRLRGHTEQAISDAERMGAEDLAHKIDEIKKRIEEELLKSNLK